MNSAMASPFQNPIILTQNRLLDSLDSPKLRLDLYRSLLARRIATAEAKRSALKVPPPRGLRLRLPRKPFHSTPELFFQEAGETRFSLPTETLTIGPSEAALIPAGMPHGESWTGPFFLNVIVMFQAESFSVHLGYLKGGKGPLRCGPIDRFASPHRFALVRYLEDISHETGAGKAAERFRYGLYIALLSRLLEGVEADLSPQSSTGPEDLLWTRCQEMIAVYFTKMDFSVTWMARELGCSPDHLSRRFRARTGRRLIEAVHHRRIDHARHLLRESDMNSAEIAWACGFSHPSHFNRVFKALSGITPRDFRNAGANPRSEKTDRSGASRSIASPPA